MKTSRNIKQFLANTSEKYDTSIRGKNKSEFGVPFWDIVVLTTADAEQKKVFEEQIRYKHERCELPADVPICVVADPPGPKLGNGGSTLTTLQFLDEMYGESLTNLRILVIHAGGQSQRMPSASVLGKIFSPIPKGDPMYQMLDIKLAMFVPLIPQMGPGVFVTCADDFLVYRLNDNDPQSMQFSKTGFTALAHPSTLQVGTGHGVYVIKDIENVNPLIPVQKCECLEVLQKPNEALMYKKGAVLKSENLHFSDGIEVSGRATYTDSSFYFSHNVTKKFLQFMKSHGPLMCEIDAYGDFLQAMGPNATSDYINNTSNVSSVTPELIQTRQSVFDLLRGTDITLLVMNASKFIHIGTTKEYINHFCYDNTFQEEMGLSKDVFNLWLDDTHRLNGIRNFSLSGAGDPENDEPVVKRKRPNVLRSDTALGCIMHSILPSISNIASTGIVEYCNFRVPINVGSNCIISNCEYNPKVKVEGSNVKVVGFDEDDPSELDFPNNLFLHTIPIKVEGQMKYVTVFFDINDNLKKVAPSNDLGKLPFMGKVVEDFATILNADVTSIQSDMKVNGSKVNLWFASLFPVTESMSQSLILALKCIDVLTKDDVKSVSLRSMQLVSMATILQQKDVFSMLSQRNEVYTTIKEGRSG